MNTEVPFATIDGYVPSGSRIGDHARILGTARIAKDVQVGKQCTVNGIPEAVIFADAVLNTCEARSDKLLKVVELIRKQVLCYDPRSLRFACSVLGMHLVKETLEKMIALYDDDAPERRIVQIRARQLLDMLREVEGA